MRAASGNELAALPDDQAQNIWTALMRRLNAIPAYKPMFEAAYPGQNFGDMNFAHAGNAMGGWIAAVFTFTNSPWDRFLAGNDAALTDAQLRGAKAFLGTAKCAKCHNGPLLTDGKFHNVAIAQVGPGFGDGPNGNDDFGRMRQTGNAVNRYQFRTPPLRNVELTAPYGHDGAIVNLRAWVDHYSQSDVKLRAYDPGQLEPLLRTTLKPTAADILATRDIRIKGLVLLSTTTDDITEFLKALTDPAARDMRQVVPVSVPSGLPIDALP
jgi:cytochrome c peroxidase